MKYQMPEPAALIRKTDSVLRLVKHPNGADFDISKWDNLYTATQVQAAYTAGRAAGLEEAVRAVKAHTKPWMAAVDAIRNLSKETPCES